jgi:autoinducer 2-degrading protein
MPYVVSVTIQVIPEQREAFIAAARDNSEHSRKEPACRQFDVSQHLEDPNRFHLYEVYDSAEGFAVHQQTAHYLRWRDAVNPMMAAPRVGVKWQRLTP